jgi:hypothetical protein
MNELKLVIIDYGDPSVGMMGNQWEIRCPFSDKDPDDRELFRKSMIEIYGEYAEGKLSSYYSDEEDCFALSAF